MQSLSEKFPPLYECSACHKSVKVTPQGDGQEPVIERSCDHVDAAIWANRKVTLRGKGVMESMPAPQRWAIKLTLTVRQFLSLLTNRSI